MEELLGKKEPPTIFLGGRPGYNDEIIRTGSIIYYNHLDSVQMRETLITSDFIISRSGYSTIMELISLDCTALLIPTPGQTEQEYLAIYLEEKGWFRTVSQRNIGTAVLASSKSKFNSKEMMEQSRKLFEEEITALLEYKQ
jgi:UDP-N-acetylglucosamine:LPS N-acetylglucosamine transferase